MEPSIQRGVSRAPPRQTPQKLLGLSKVLQRLRGSEALIDSSLRELQAANSKAFREVATTIQLPDIDSDDPICWHIAHPNWLLTTTAEQCPNFARVLIDTLKKHPSTKEKP